MEKLIYLLWAPKDRPVDDIKRVLLEECTPKLLEQNLHKLSMNFNDSDADIPAPVPPPQGEEPLAAEVSIWLDCYDRRKPFENILEQAGCRMAGYLVTESLFALPHLFLFHVTFHVTFAATHHVHDH